MPNFISNGGEWTAAKEKVLVQPKEGEAFLYEGPDRAAEEIIKKESGGLSDKIGMPASQDPQMLEVARQHGLTMDQWMERNKPNPAQEENIKKARSKTVTHSPEPKKPSVDTGTKGGFVDRDGDYVKDFDKKY